VKVLIIEDSGEKAQKIAEAIEYAGVPEDCISIIPDAVAARDRLRQGGADLLVLDLQIPRRFGESARGNGGADLLQWLDRRQAEQMPPHIIAVTSFDLEPETAAVLNSLGVSVVRYQQSSDDWRGFIVGLTSRVLRNRRAGLGQAEDVDAVLLTTVDVEYSQAKRVFRVEGAGEVKLGVTWHRAEVDADGDRRRVIIAQASQMGMPSAAVLAIKAIRLWQPRLMIMSGVCAGVRGEVELGDIVVPDPCWDLGSGKLANDGVLKPDPRPIPLRESVRAVLAVAAESAPIEDWRRAWMADSPRRIPAIHIRPAASGASVVSDTRTIPQIVEHSRKVAGVDMENYGFYYACANSGLSIGPDYCSVKGVVDFADPDKSDDVQAYAAYLSARLAEWIVARHRR